MSFDERAATMEHEEIVALLASHDALHQEHALLSKSRKTLATRAASLETRADALESRNAELTRQVEWFKRQLFGPKSERRTVDPDGRQLSLGEWGPKQAPDEEITVAEHRRRTRPRRDDETADEGELRFDDIVPVEEVVLPAPEVDGEHEVVSHKVTYRLGQKPASYVLLKYVRPVVKPKADDTLSQTPAPPAVLGKGLADVSLLAAMAIDKFRFHLPLYRQHQRMAAAGVKLARSTLTGWMQRTTDLLHPIYESLVYSVITGDVVTMDETPIKAGRKHRGKMKTGYFWPIYGDRDEVVFPFSSSRSSAVLHELLGKYAGVLVSDGYKAYEAYAAKTDSTTHAQCWSGSVPKSVEKRRLHSAVV